VLLIESLTLFDVIEYILFTDMATTNCSNSNFGFKQINTKKMYDIFLPAYYLFSQAMFFLTKSSFLS